MTAAPILLYDGDCAFCARSMRFLLDHDTRRRDARFAAKTSAAGHAVLARHPGMAAVDSLVWVESTASAGEVALVRSDALLAIARYLGGGWAALGAMSRVIPRALRELGYRAIAANRRRLSFGAPACVVFSAAEQARVLDGPAGGGRAA
jgi:predicted DCC family thiol-disulfide oxidoreductase YuxK